MSISESDMMKTKLLAATFPQHHLVRTSSDIAKVVLRPRQFRKDAVHKSESIVGKGTLENLCDVESVRSRLKCGM